MHCSPPPIAILHKGAETMHSYCSCTTLVPVTMKLHNLASAILILHAFHTEIIHSCSFRARAISSDSVHCGQTRIANSPIWTSTGQHSPTSTSIYAVYHS